MFGFGDPPPEPVSMYRPFWGFDGPFRFWAQQTQSHVEAYKPFVSVPISSTALLSHVLQQQIGGMRTSGASPNRHGYTADGPYPLRMPLTTVRFQHAAISRSQSQIPLLRKSADWRIDHWYSESIETYASRIQKLPQMGPWTTYHALAVSMGEPDVIVTGDYTLPHTVSWALIGKARSTDDEMKRLLEPFKGNRWRLVRLLWALNIAAPRRGPRLSSSHTRRW